MKKKQTPGERICMAHHGGIDRKLVGRINRAIRRAQAQALEKLAATLFDKMNRLDPGDENTWAEVAEADRHFYRACVESIVMDREAVIAALEANPRQSATPEQRARLVEVMARGIRSSHGIIYEGAGYPSPDVVHGNWLHYAREAIAAAERAGFKIEGPKP